MSLNALESTDKIIELLGIASPENSIIVSMINNPSEFPAFCSVLEKEHFQIKNNRIIFEEMFECYRNSESWNMVTLCLKLKDIHEYIVSIFTHQHNNQPVHTALNIAEKIAYESRFNYQKQRLEALSKELNKENKDFVASEIIDLLSDKEEQVSESVNTLLPAYWEYINKPKHFIDTQFEKLNKANGGGWELGAVHTIAGRPAQGKTAMMLSLVRHDLEMKRKVGIISLEMSSNQLFTRLISNISRIDNHDIKNYEITRENDTKRIAIAKAYMFMQESEMFIYDRTFITAIQLYNKIKLWKLNHNIDIVYIDYLGKIDHNTKGKNELLTYAIDDTMKWIVASAKENNIPIILLCQIDRQTDKKRDPTNFTLSDLSDSKSIEAYSHSVSFLVRPETYNIKLYGENEQDQIDTKGLAILDICKNRDGYLGKILMKFTNYATLFEPLEILKKYEEAPKSLTKNIEW